MATKNPSMEDFLGSSLCTIAHPKLLKILPRSANFFQRSAAPVGAPESAEWFTFRRNFFILDKAEALPIMIESQTVWQAIRLDFKQNGSKRLAIINSKMQC